MQNTWPPTGRQRPDHPKGVDPVLLLLTAGVEVARGPDVPAELLDPFAGGLAARVPRLRSPQADELGSAAVRALYGRGWQPADVVHVARRRVSQRAGRLAAALATAEATASGAADRAPAAWVDQLHGLGPAAGIGQWWDGAGVDATTGWRDVVRLLALLPTLPRLEHLLPPPSAWPARRAPSAPASGPGPVEPKMLARVRALLTKAESTSFPDEADALTAKAQQLMSRYAIDAAVLADSGPGSGPGGPGGTVLARRLHLDDPYAEPKAHLVQAVATANGCRVVLLAELGIATVIGLPVDADLVEMLFTSLLLQVTRALADTTRAGSSRTRSAVFRRGFLYAYAGRVGERLTEAREQAATEAAGTYGSALVPVLARRQEAVDSAVEELFPRLVTRRGPSVDPAGWHAGRRAADDADLGSGRSPLRR